MGKRVGVLVKEIGREVGGQVNQQLDGWVSK